MSWVGRNPVNTNHCGFENQWWVRGDSKIALWWWYNLFSLSLSLPFADLPLLTGGWLMCFIRRRSVPKCRSCRKDSSGAVKSVQPGCSWIQFPWPANSLVAIYSEVRFLMSGVSNLFCLQGIWQSKKQLLRTAQTLSQNCGGQRPAHSSQPKAQPVTLALSLLPAGPQTGTTAYFNSCSELQETTN